MYCWKCGKQIPENSLFCNGCGAAMKRQEQPVKPETPVDPPAQSAQEPAPQPADTGEILLPTEAVPVKPPREKMTLEELWIRFFCFAMTLGFGALGMLFLWEGIWILTVVFALLVYCMIVGWEQAMLLMKIISVI